MEWVIVPIKIKTMTLYRIKVERILLDRFSSYNMKKVGGLSKMLCLGSVLVSQSKEPAIIYRGYYEERWLPSSLSNVSIETKGSLGLMELVLELHHENSHIYSS